MYSSTYAEVDIDCFFLFGWQVRTLVSIIHVETILFVVRSINIYLCARLPTVVRITTNQINGCCT